MKVQPQSRATQYARVAAKLIVNNPLPFFLTLFVVLFAITLKSNVAADEARANTPQALAEQRLEEQRSDDELAINLALDFVKNRLRDPGSASFSDVRIVRKTGSKAVCGRVNAKNGFGGMAGAEQFVVADYHARLASMGPEEVAEIKRLC